jgi:hypothetical protein
MPVMTAWTMLVMGLALGAETGEGRASTPWDDLGDEELALIMREAAAWISEQRDLHRPLARRLDGDERRALAGFFETELLDAARVRFVERIENPGFYSMFVESGRPIPIDFSGATGLAVMDTVLIVESRARPGAPSWLPLLFHELVHVAQYRHLGLEPCAEEYVRGWVEGGFSYRAIPMEIQAYELAARFGRAPGDAFSVSTAVRSRFGLDE